MLGFLRKRHAERTSPSTQPARIPDGDRVYAIGDVHGHNDMLVDLLARIAADSRQRGPARVVLVMLGDLIDRGPDSRRVIETLTTVPAGFDELILLRGNHEEMLLKILDQPKTVFDGWLQFGGRETLASYNISSRLAYGTADALVRAMADRIPARHVTLLRELRTSHTIGDYLFVHAGIRPGVALHRQSERDMLWIRDSFLDSDANHGAIVVHGHTPVDEIDERPNRINLDTGAYRTGVLSAIGLEGSERWFLQAVEERAASAA